MGGCCDFLYDAAEEIERLRVAMHDAFMAMCAYKDSRDEKIFQDAIDALGMASSFSFEEAP
jgi:hypothetical protein